MSSVFTPTRSKLDRALLALNAALGALFVGALGLGVAGVRPDGWLDVPVAVVLFAWLFATPILAGLGGYRAHTSGWRRAVAAHSVLAGAWALGMAAALVLPLLRTAA